MTIIQRDAVMAKRVLVADDDSMMGELLKKFFKKLNFEVTTATNGKDGLDKFSQAEFDLVLTDLEMPEMDGFEFIREILLINDKQIIIAMSGNDAYANSAEACGVNFIRKPFTLDQLESLVEVAMGK